VRFDERVVDGDNVNVIVLEAIENVSVDSIFPT
jgi:hypothetical protein